jgi:hypothetical protein
MTNLLHLSDGKSLLSGYFSYHPFTCARAHTYITFRDLALFYIRLITCHNTDRNLIPLFASLIAMVRVLCPPTSKQLTFIIWLEI